MIKKSIAILLLITSGGLLAGCNTLQGFGRDVERAGEKVQEVGKR